MKLDLRLDAFESYIASVRTASTASKYAAATRKFDEWLAEQAMTLEDAPRSAVANYCAALVDAGYLSATVCMQIAGVNRYLKWRDREDMPTPDFYSAELPKNNSKIKDALTPELLGAYFRLADELDEPVRSAVMLLPCVGLRGGEMVSLPFDCLRRTPLKLKDGCLKETLTLVVRGKGGDERVVPLLDEGAEIMMGYLTGWRRDHRDETWLFPGKFGHLSDRTLRAAVQRVRQPLKMRFTPHTMRRTYLTTLYRHGVEPVTIAKIAGHKDVKTLMMHYLALDEQDIAGAVHNAGGSLT